MAALESSFLPDARTGPQRCAHWIKAQIRRRSIRYLLLIFPAVFLIGTFVGEVSMVPTASMEGTILVGDHLFLNKMLYGPEIPLVHLRLPMLKAVQRGEIVVFRYPGDPSQTFLKRVAAVGGDEVEIRDGILYVNSRAIIEPYAVHHGPRRLLHEHMSPLSVPPGQLFVMGDNRDNSFDSRDWGFVPVLNVIGEPLLVYWSYDAPTASWLDEDFGRRIQFYGSIMGNFFSRTRWERVGTVL
jgi:signal peptidase I